MSCGRQLLVNKLICFCCWWLIWLRIWDDMAVLGVANALLCNIIYIMLFLLVHLCWCPSVYNSFCKDGKKRIGRVASRKDEDELHQLKILCEGSGVKDLSKLKVLCQSQDPWQLSEYLNVFAYRIYVYAGPAQKTIGQSDKKCHCPGRYVIWDLWICGL